MQALELVEDETAGDRTPARAMTARSSRRRAARSPVGKGGLEGNCFRIAPALNVSAADVDEALALLRSRSRRPARVRDSKKKTEDGFPSSAFRSSRLASARLRLARPLSLSCAVRCRAGVAASAAQGGRARGSRAGLAGRRLRLRGGLCAEDRRAALPAPAAREAPPAPSSASPRGRARAILTAAGPRLDGLALRSRHSCARGSVRLGGLGQRLRRRLLLAPGPGALGLRLGSLGYSWASPSRGRPGFAGGALRPRRDGPGSSRPRLRDRRDAQPPPASAARDLEAAARHLLRTRATGSPVLCTTPAVTGNAVARWARA
jgi:hypothetical protein